MARINVETKVWSMPAVQKLMIKMGDRHKAKGVLIDLWELAQTHWFPDRKLIPEQAFKHADLPDILFDLGLAEKRLGGIYAKGSEEAFAWLFEKRAAGLASAEARKEKYGTAQPINPHKKVEGESSNTVRTAFEQQTNDVEQSRSSLLLSPSSFLSSPSSPLTAQDSLLPLGSPSDSDESSDLGETCPQSSTKKKGKARKPKKERPPGFTNDTWEAYHAAYCKKYDVEPCKRDGAVNGMLGRFIDMVGAEDAPGIAAFYLTHRDAFYASGKHPLKLLLSDAQKLRTEFLTNNMQTLSDARKEEKGNFYRNQMRDVAVGVI